MIELSFNPQVGERVQVFPSSALFEIVDRHASAAGELLLTLRRLQDGKLFEKISPIVVDYPSDERVRRELRKIVAQCDWWPEDFQEQRFDVKSDEMYDGTPRIMVYFHLKPGAVPSVPKARIWNNFYAKLQERLQPLVDGGTWLQFTTKEERSALSVAS